MLLADVVDFPLSVRAYNILANLAIETVPDLARLFKEDRLRRQRNCGAKTAAEIEALARFLGVRLDTADDPSGSLVTEFRGKRVAESDGGFPIAWLIRVDSVPLSWRATRGLRELGCRFVGDLATATPQAALDQSLYGRTTLKEILRVFGGHGAFLGYDNRAWKHVDPCSLEKRYQSELRSIREELLVRKFGPEILGHSTVEEEVSVALSKSGGHNGERLLAWIGFQKDADPTYLKVADHASVSQTRIRQVVNAAKLKLRRYDLPTPTLDRAIRLIERTLPARDDRIEARLRQAGVIGEGTRARGVVRAARLFNEDWNIESRRVGNHVFWVSSGDTVYQHILSEVKHAIDRIGVARVRDVAVAVSDLTGRERLSAPTEEFLSAMDGLSWLDEKGGWFWFHGKPRNRLRQRIEKILAAAGRIELSELRAGVDRGGQIAALPTLVLRRFCEQLPGCAVATDSNEIVDESARSTHRFLSESEQRLLRICKEFGPVMERAEIVSRATRAGLKRATVDGLLTQSPILLRLDSELYGLIGSLSSAGLVAEKRLRSPR